MTRNQLKLKRIDAAIVGAVCVIGMVAAGFFFSSCQPAEIPVACCDTVHLGEHLTQYRSEWEEKHQYCVFDEPTQSNPNILGSFVSNPYADISLNEAEKILLARMAYTEARGEGMDGQVAVIQTALNRYLHPKFDSDITKLLTAPKQFAVGKKYTDEQLEAVEWALAGYPALGRNTDVVFFSTGSLKRGSYFSTIGNHEFRTYT